MTGLKGICCSVTGEACMFFSHKTLTFISGMLSHCSRCQRFSQFVQTCGFRCVKVHLRFLNLLFRIIIYLTSIFSARMETCDHISDITGQKPAPAAVSRSQSPTCCNNHCEMKVCFSANRPLNLRRVRERRVVGDVYSSWPTSGGETRIPDKRLDYGRSL